VTGFSQSAESAFLETTSTVAKLVQMYPNPATDYLIVKLQTPHANDVKLAMHSVIGNVLNIDKEIVDEYELRIRVKDLPTGYYFLSIKEEESGLKASYKFLKR
jgi:hypothetical protein